jgi:hypothetical protein
MVDGEREELDVTGVEGGNDVNVCGIIAITTKLRLCFLVVPGGSGSRIGLDTRGSRGRFGDNNVDGQIGGGGGCRAAEVGWKKDQANISGAGRVVRDKVTRFGDNTVAGSDEVGPRANISTDNVKGVMDVGTEHGFADAAAAKEMVTEGVKRGMAARAREMCKIIGEAG